ncbi:MAG: glycosyltransferase family 39 protein [Myxococcota bacterium]
MSSRRYDLISVGLILLIGSAYQLTFLREGIGLIDEGHLANAARRLVGGDVLYRDVYSVYPPASFHAVAALFEIFGQSLIVVRSFHVVMTLACAVAAYGWARKVMAPGWAWLAGMLVAVTGWESLIERCHYSYLYSVFPVCAMLLILGRPQETLSRRRLLGIGLLTGLTLMFRLVPFVALVAALAAVVFLSSGLNRSGGRQAGWIALGAALVILPFGVFYALSDALGEGLRAVFWTSFGQYIQGDSGGSDFNLPFPPLQILPASLSRVGLQNLWIVWEFYLPILIYAATFVEFGVVRLGLGGSGSAVSTSATTAATADGTDSDASGSASQTRRVARLSMAIFGAILFLRATGRSDYYHLAPVLVPAYLLGVDYLGRGGETLLRRLRRGSGVEEARLTRRITQWEPFVVSVCVLLLSGFLHNVDNASRGARKIEGKVALADGGPYVPSGSRLYDLVREIRSRTQSKDPILVLPWYPVLYFLAERDNPTRFDWLFPGYLNSELETARFVDSIEGSRAKTVIYSPAAIDGRQDRSLSGFAPSLDRYLRQSFRPVKWYGSFLLMERRQAGFDRGVEGRR